MVAWKRARKFDNELEPGESVIFWRLFYHSGHHCIRYMQGRSHADRSFRYKAVYFATVQFSQFGNLTVRSVPRVGILIVRD